MVKGIGCFIFIRLKSVKRVLENFDNDAVALYNKGIKHIDRGKTYEQQ